MSALTDLFTAMANKIRSKTGTQTTYTPSEMVSDGIDDVYDAGVAAGGTSTPITPSNSSPASMTSGTKYTPSTNGYAIASYDSVTPSSTPESVASGDIVKMGGSGVIVDAMPPTPTSITPSNATPVALTANTPVTPTASGYAIASYDTRSPSNLNPGPLTSGEIYKVSNSGYAIATYSDVTPSNSSPVSLTSGEINKMGGNGYAIASYTSVTPSSTPASVSTGDIVKMGGNGVVVDAVPTPTSITPSNISPPFLATGEAVSPTRNGYAVQSIEPLTPSNSNPVPIEYLYGNIYQSAGNGYAIESYSSITPSNSSPVSLSSGSFYKPSASGYAISSYSSKTPSDTSPASVSSGAIVKASSAGYLVKNTPVNIGVPDIVSQANMNGGASRSITVTKMPRYIVFLMTRNSDSTGRNYSWFYDVANSKHALIQYTADGYSHSESTGAPTTISATSSSVTVTNTATVTCRTHALIYY